MRGSNSQSPTEVMEKVLLCLLDDSTTKSFKRVPLASSSLTVDSKPTDFLPQDFIDPHTTLLSFADPSFASLAFLVSP